MTTRIAASCGAFLLSLGLLRAEASIQRYFPTLGGYRFIMERETSSSADTDGTLAPELLDEAVLKSYSVWRLEGINRPSLALDVYELLDPSGAYQLFASWPDTGLGQTGRSLPLGTGNHFQEKEAVFWRGNFFIRLRPLDLPSLGEEDLSTLVRHFQMAIPTENLLPVSISHLPRAGLVDARPGYYLGPASLAQNPHFPPILLDEIGFGDKAEVAFGLYEPGPSALFVISYPTPTLAADYMVRIQDQLRDFFSEHGVFLKRSGVLISLLIGAAPEAQQILADVKYKPTVKWISDTDSRRSDSKIRTFLGLVTQTLLGIGVSLLMVVAAGLAVGLIRYEALKRFPILTTRNEMIRLKLEGR